MNNNPKSNTQRYSTPKYTPRNNRGRRNDQNKLVFFILLAVLILALIAAIVFVAVDLIGMNSSDTTEGVGEGTGGEQSPDGHPMSNAYDKNSESYALVKINQSAGSYFSCEFDAPADVGEVIFSSMHPDHYIRGCDIQLRVDGEWQQIGVFGSAPGERVYPFKNIALVADGIRIVLTENADTHWAINEITVRDKNGYHVSLRAPSAGTNSDATVTEAPSDTGAATEPPEVTTAPPETEPPEPGYVTLEISNDRLYSGDLILVNAQYAYRFPSTSASLITVYNEYVANNYRCNYFDDVEMQLEAVAAHSILAMANALHAETELNWLKLGTGYRSYETQQSLSEKYPTTAALPGYSEHHTGLGVDLQVWDKNKNVSYNLDDPDQNCQKIYTWISANAYKYGFIRRFAPDKDLITGISSDRWHYRYVGAPHAYYMTVNNLCLEEYLAALENCTYEGDHLMIDVDGKIYEVYYVAAEDGTSTTLPVPSDPSLYTVSGNNYSGFIVTVTRN